MTETKVPEAETRSPDFPADAWTRIGMIVPSSNTVLEPYTQAMVAPLANKVSVHFARMKVVEISLSAASQQQFSGAPVVAAAAQLADARCDVVAWNGTSGSWLGAEGDEALVSEIEAETGARATTTTLAFRDAYRLLNVKTLGLVTPYVSEIQERIIKNYADMSIEVSAERHLGDHGNFSFAEYSPELVADLIREVAAAQPDAIAVVCTNFRGAIEAAALEREFGIPVLDSVAVTLWDCLRKAGVDPAPIDGAGRLFQSHMS